MKRQLLYPVVIFILGLLAYTGAKKMSFEFFQEGFSAASKTYTTCPFKDESKMIFPQYFDACGKLCRSLYKQKNLCVSSINGGSVTCVCEQKE